MLALRKCYIDDFTTYIDDCIIHSEGYHIDLHTRTTQKSIKYYETFFKTNFIGNYRRVIC